MANVPTITEASPPSRVFPEDVSQISQVLGDASPATPTSQPPTDFTGGRGTMDALLALDTLTAPAKPSPPPSFSRLPPDGHEFPTNYTEQFCLVPAAPMEMEEKEPPPLPRRPPPPSRKLSADDMSPRWRKDEKSEKSVRDKIAMFSSAGDGPLVPEQPRRLSKHGSSDCVFLDESDCSPGKLLSRSTLSVDRVGRRVAHSTTDLTCPDPVAPSLGYSSTLPRKLKTPQTGAEHKPSGLSRATSFSGGAGLHGRSQSLVDVAWNGAYKSAEESRRASLNALIEQRRRGISKLRGLVIPERVAEVSPIIDLPEIKSRDSILAPALNPTADSRPTATSRWTLSAPPPPTSAPSLMTSPPWRSQAPVPSLPKYSPAFKRKSLTLCGQPSSAPSSRLLGREELRPPSDKPPSSQPPSKPPRNTPVSPNRYPPSVPPPLPPPDPPKSLESITSPTRSDLSFEFVSSSSSSPDLRMAPPANVKEDILFTSNQKLRNGKYSNGDYYSSHVNTKLNRSSLPVKNLLSPDAGRSEDDSDNDSAVSSSRSSISHGFSPPQSPLPDGQQRATDDQHRQHPLLSHLPLSAGVGDRRPLRRTLSSETTASVASSTASTLTSGSQASSSSGDSNKRVLKAQSVEAINRKNVLSSARYSSGRDLKVGSPLIKRKFDEDGNEYTEIYEEHNTDMLKGELNGPPCIDANKDEYAGIDGAYKKPVSNETQLKENKVTIQTSLKKSKDIIHYRMVPEENSTDIPNVIYFEVQEAERSEICGDFMDSADNSDMCSSASSIMTDSADNYAPPVPLPAPRRTSIPTSTKKLIMTDIETASDDMKWTLLQSKYTLDVAEEDHTSKADAQIFVNEMNMKKADTKQFTLDLEKRTLTMETGSHQPLYRSASIDVREEHKTDLALVNEDVAPMHFMPVAPVVPPKPVQRKVAKVSESQAENVNGELDIRPTESDLMSILTGKSNKDPAVPVQLRERRRSRDTDFIKATATDVHAPPAPQSLTNGSSKTEEILDTERQAKSRVPTASLRSASNRRSVSVNDIRKAFEKAELALANTGRSGPDSIAKTTKVVASNGVANHHVRVSSLDSTTSEDSFAQNPGLYGSASNLQREQFGSVTSIASTTSLISQQELQSLIDEANQVLEESGGSSSPVYEVVVVVLHREIPGGSIGITLAGGADYEVKEITVHKVLTGSPADRDGRIQKGDRILSINGRSMKGVTHRESLNILKAPRSEVVLVVSRSRTECDGLTPSDDSSVPVSKSSLSAISSRHPRIPELPLDGMQTSEKSPETPRGPPVTVNLLKDGAGLGFSLEGGKDSPLGDKPLTIKKIFTGGSAEKNGQLHAGDELLNVNGTDVTLMSRIEAWGLMKKLSDGNVTLTVRHRVANTLA